jgi:hypothetical protein
MTAIVAGRDHGIDWSGQKLELTASEAQLQLLQESLADAADGG